MRELIAEEGFFPRVDLFTTPEQAMKFIPTPCDVYEIYTGRLILKKLKLVEHPFGDFYSYFEIIPAELIKSKVTYRELG